MKSPTAYLLVLVMLAQPSLLIKPKLMTKLQSRTLKEQMVQHFVIVQIFFLLAGKAWGQKARMPKP
jgi:uncharacterized protein YdaU (DUF1376 family)